MGSKAGGPVDIAPEPTAGAHRSNVLYGVPILPKCHVRQARHCAVRVLLCWRARYRVLTPYPSRHAAPDTITDLLDTPIPLILLLSRSHSFCLFRCIFFLFSFASLPFASGSSLAWSENDTAICALCSRVSLEMSDEITMVGTLHHRVDLSSLFASCSPHVCLSCSVVCSSFCSNHTGSHLLNVLNPNAQRTMFYLSLSLDLAKYLPNLPHFHLRFFGWRSGFRSGCDARCELSPPATLPPSYMDYEYATPAVLPEPIQPYHTVGSFPHAKKADKALNTTRALADPGYAHAVLENYARTKLKRGRSKFQVGHKLEGLEKRVS